MGEAGGGGSHDILPATLFLFQRVMEMRVTGVGTGGLLNSVRVFPVGIG